MNYRQLLKLLAAATLFLGMFMLPSLLLGIIDGEGWWPFALALTICLASSLTVLKIFRGAAPDMGRREGFLLVATTWVLASFAGALPFYFSGHFLSFTDALFEAVSGYTTTGATVLPRVSHLPRALLLWRSLIQWLGGMGIVLLTMAIMPMLGFGGVMLFKAEVPGPVVEKLRPRIRATALLLWWVYAAITAAAALSLVLAGMAPFDALCHAFTVMATGGFSTHDAGIMGFQNPLIEWVLILFMILAGCNFVLHYHALRGHVRIYARNEECRWYLGFLLLITGLTWLLLSAEPLAGPAGERLRHALFQTASLMTTTGYHTADFEAWRLAAPMLVPLLIVAMCLGGMGGSTGGGIKTVRILTVLKHIRNEMRQLSHPRLQQRIRINGIILQHERLRTMLAFVLLHSALLLVVAMAMAALGLDPVSAISAAAATLNNIGPGFGSVGPLSNYEAVPALGKWILMAAMLIGRLELFTIMVLLTPAFWRR